MTDKGGDIPPGFVDEDEEELLPDAEEVITEGAGVTFVFRQSRMMSRMAAYVV